MVEPKFGVRQMTDLRRAAIARLIKGLDCDFVRALEVGSYEGSSALAISNAIGARAKSGGSLMCLDPWQPYFAGEPSMGENTSRMDADLASGIAFERFKANIEHAHSQAPIAFKRSTLGDALSSISGIAFDFVFLDGCHRYTEASDDIRNARGLVRAGGILAGDDLERQGEKIYRDVYEGREQDMFRGCHAGVTCAVWESFGEVFCDEGIWAVRRSGAGWDRPA